MVVSPLASNMHRQKFMVTSLNKGSQKGCLFSKDQQAFDSCVQDHLITMFPRVFILKVCNLQDNFEETHSLESHQSHVLRITPTPKMTNNNNNN